MSVDYTSARGLLDTTLRDVEALVVNEQAAPQVSRDLSRLCDRVFASKTQAYREALLGCLLAKTMDTAVNPRKPYVNMGEGAYNGRTIDERVVNPFLQENRIPCSKGPFLSAFRRSVAFEEATRVGLRDKDGFDAMLGCVAYIEKRANAGKLTALLAHLIYRFVRLREEANVPLNRIHRFSRDQYASLIDLLLAAPSGGRFPVFLIVSAFKAISNQYGLNWHVAHQGINVADGVSGAGGDITISTGKTLLMAAEVTERSVGRDRVVSTFNTKIAPASIEDYLFFVNQEPDQHVRKQCQQYFAQGHEVSFVQIATWLNMMLVTIGKAGRENFNEEMLALLDGQDTPQAVRAAWNTCVNAVIEVT